MKFPQKDNTVNVLHMKYMIEVAKDSLNKTCKSFLVTLPNLSRSIKELMQYENSD